MAKSGYRHSRVCWVMCSTPYLFGFAIGMMARDVLLPGLEKLSKALWAKSEARADEVETGLEDEIGAELDFLAAHWPKELPSGVIHADLFPDNVLMLHEQVTGLGEGTQSRR